MNSNRASGKMKPKFRKSGDDKRKLETSVEVFDNLLGSIREPLLVLDSDLRVVTANHSFYRTFNVKPDETVGILIYDLGNGQWNIPKLRELLEDILPQNSVLNDFEVEHNFETIGRKIMHLNAKYFSDYHTAASGSHGRHTASCGFLRQKNFKENGQNH